MNPAVLIALIVLGIVTAGWQAWRNYCEFLRALGDDMDVGDELQTLQPTIP